MLHTYAVSSLSVPSALFPHEHGYPKHCSKAYNKAAIATQGSGWFSMLSTLPTDGMTQSPFAGFACTSHDSMH